MADGNQEQNEKPSSSTWWDSWYDTAKKKLTETNEFMMRDISEFTQAVKEDASKLVASTAAQMKDQLNININLEEASEATKTVTNTLTDFLGKVVQQVSPQHPDDSDDDSFLLGTRSGVKMLSPAEARLYHLQTSPETYCTEPDSDLEYSEWFQSFILEEKKEEVSLLMLDCKEVRSLYTKLVPDAVSHAKFWTRYFFKKHMQEKAEDRRAKLVQRAEKSSNDELTWDEDDDFVDDIKDVACSSTSVKDMPQAINVDLPSTTSIIECIPSLVDNSVNGEVDEAEKVNEAISPTTTTASVFLKEKLEETPLKTKQVCDEVVASSQEPCTVVLEDDISKIDELSSIKNTECADDKSETTTLSSKEASSCEIVESIDLKNSKDVSSGDSSDWEKEFDMDMTEEEINNTLLQQSADAPDDDWDSWE